MIASLFQNDQTFSIHADLEAFLESAKLAAISVLSRHFAAVIAIDAAIDAAIANRSFEEALKL